MGKRYKSTKKKRRRNSLTPVVLILAGVFLVGASLLFVLPKNTSKSSSTVANKASENHSNGKTLANGMPSAIPSETNFAAPDLSLKDLKGKEDSLKDYLGKVVLVNNWATWCPPCTAELPELEAYYEAHSDDGFVIIGIEAGEPASQVSAFIEQNGITYPIWVDPNNDALRAFKKNGLPNSIVIDRQGIARLTWTGAISYDVLEEYVTPLINE